MAGMAAKLFEHPFGELLISPLQLTKARPRQGPPAEPADRPTAVIHGPAGLLQEDAEERGLPWPVCREYLLCLELGAACGPGRHIGDMRYTRL